jgi:hypothetical protein
LADLAHQGHVVTVTGVNVGATPAPDDDEVGVSGLDWTVDRAVQMLRQAQPAGSVFLRALVDEGGHATAARLRELTGVDRLNPMTSTLNAATRKVFGARRLAYDDRHLARPGKPPEDPRAAAVHDYTLPEQLVPILDEALRQLGR